MGINQNNTGKKGAELATHPYQITAKLNETKHKAHTLLNLSINSLIPRTDGERNNLITANSTILDNLDYITEAVKLKDREKLIKARNTISDCISSISESLDKISNSKEKNNVSFLIHFLTVLYKLEYESNILDTIFQRSFSVTFIEQNNESPIYNDRIFELIGIKDDLELKNIFSNKKIEFNKKIKKEFLEFIPDDYPDFNSFFAFFDDTSVDILINHIRAFNRFDIDDDTDTRSKYTGVRNLHLDLQLPNGTKVGVIVSMFRLPNGMTAIDFMEPIVERYKEDIIDDLDIENKKKKPLIRSSTRNIRELYEEIREVPKDIQGINETMQSFKGTVNDILNYSESIDAIKEHGSNPISIYFDKQALHLGKAFEDEIEMTRSEMNNVISMAQAIYMGQDRLKVMNMLNSLMYDLKSLFPFYHEHFTLTSYVNTIRKTIDWLTTMLLDQKTTVRCGIYRNTIEMGEFTEWMKNQKKKEELKELRIDNINLEEIGRLEKEINKYRLRELEEIKEEIKQIGLNSLSKTPKTQELEKLLLRLAKHLNIDFKKLSGQGWLNDGNSESIIRCTGN